MVRKTNFLCVSVLVSEIVYFMSKRKVLYEFPPKCFKTTERHCFAVCGSLFGVKQFLLIFILHYRFVQKKLFKQIQIFHRTFPFSNMFRKINFQSISVLFSEIVIFISKKKFLYQFPKKYFKPTERDSLAVCGSIFGEIRVFFIFIPFNWFDQKQLFKPIDIFLRICRFKHGKKNKLSEYFSDCV